MPEIIIMRRRRKSLGEGRGRAKGHGTKGSRLQPGRSGDIREGLNLPLVTGHMSLVTSSIVMCGPHFCSMRITEDVRRYAAEQSLAEEEAVKHGLAQKAAEFAEKGSELYAKA